MDLTLHIGAHRTGSTLIDTALTATVAAHPGCGVAVWGPRRLRDMPGFQATTRLLDAHTDPVSKDAAIVLDALASQFAAEVVRVRTDGARALILSEENFIGSMGNNFRTGTFYGDVARRLAAFDSVLPMSPRRVALGVRDYGSVWTSAVHYLPQVGKEAPDLASARAVLMNDKRGWPDLVAAIKSVWPDSGIVMWRQEDLAGHAAAICADLLALPRDQIVLPEGRVNARTARTPRPEVFSAADRKHLTHRYNRHVRRMEEDPVVQWLGVAA